MVIEKNRNIEFKIYWIRGIFWIDFVIFISLDNEDL